jgi:hypothetical protein
VANEQKLNNTGFLRIELIGFKDFVRGMDKAEWDNIWPNWPFEFGLLLQDIEKRLLLC